MFRETLLESAPLRRRWKPWPLAAAFSLESAVAAALVALPLLSSGVISISARPPVVVPHLEKPPVRNIIDKTRAAGRGGGAAFIPPVVTLASGPRAACLIHCPKPADETAIAPDTALGNRSDALPSVVTGCVSCRASRPSLRPYVVSDLAPGSLIRRVEPVYPRMAALANVRGVVRLHAVIAKDGTIQSLTVIDGPPLLVAAARDAVSQWRYRPYILNGQPVEVETMITVNFQGGD